MKDYILTAEGVVGPSWIDDNDHMNVMFYTHVIDLATRGLLATMRISDTGDAPDFVAARVSTAHRREIGLGAPWQTWSGLSAVSDRNFICTHKVMSAGAVAARSDITIVPFDRIARRSTVFSAAAVSKATDYLIDGLGAR